MLQFSCASATLASRVALKAALMDVVYCSARGVASSPDQRAGVEERPLSALHGRWKLVYTSHPQTLLLLTALDSLPLVDVGDVYQVVDTSAMTAYNKIDVTTPLSLISSLTAEARFEVQPPQALRVHLRRVGLDGQVQTPQ
ncbi:plastid lipid associated protein, partial [Haematococcus lacustris]